MIRVFYAMTIALVLSAACAFAADYDLIVRDTFDDGATHWQPMFPENWRLVEHENEQVYEVFRVGESHTIRKPRCMSILTPYVVGSFELRVRAKCYTDPTTKNRDLCLFFGYQDDVHFYYAHFSGNSDNVHNAIHIVNNADRVKINNEPAGESRALLKEIQWYTLTVKRDATSGLIEAFVDGEKVLTAVDSTFKTGKIGIGSFDDTGAFQEVTLWGERIATKVGQKNTTPEEFWLGQNYPNPFNPRTRIDYKLPENDVVCLTIFDACGRHLASPVQHSQQAGHHSICIKADAWPSGIYYYKLSTTLFSDVKKMTLLH